MKSKISKNVADHFPTINVSVIKKKSKRKQRRKQISVSKSINDSSLDKMATIDRLENKLIPFDRPMKFPKEVGK